MIPRSFVSLSLQFEALDDFALLAEVVLDQVLHDDAVEGDVPACKQLLVEQLLPHELHEDVLVLGLYLRKHALVRYLLQMRQLLQVLPDRLVVVLLPHPLLQGFLGLGGGRTPPVGGGVEVEEGTAVELLPLLVVRTGRHPFAFLRVLGDVGRPVQALVVFDPPDLVSLVLGLGQYFLEVLAEGQLVLVGVVELELFVVVLDLVGLELQGDVPQAAQLVVLHQDHAHALSPQAVLERMVEDDLIEEYLGGCPYLYAVVLCPTQHHSEVASITHHNNVLLVIDRLPVQDHCGFLLVAAEFGNVEKPSLPHNDKVFLKAIDLRAHIPAVDGVETVGLILWKIDNLHILFLADRHQPILPCLLVHHLLEVNHPLPMVTHPSIYGTHIQRRHKYDGAPTATYGHQSQSTVSLLPCLPTARE